MRTLVMALLLATPWLTDKPFHGFGGIPDPYWSEEKQQFVPRPDLDWDRFLPERHRGERNRIYSPKDWT
jgi:hypothetical protein